MTFQHRQPVSIMNIRLGVMPDGQRVFWEDWSERATIRATKRDRNGYCDRWTVKRADGSIVDIHQDQLRAA